MCGIAGAIGRVGAAELRAVRAINAAQAHRGPDGEGLWASQPAQVDPTDDSPAGVVLGHRRLAVLDPRPLGRQPMEDAGSGCVLSYNGEIYNFRELRRELEGQGQRFASGTDTEVLLKGYATWGAGVVDRLRGMFAFAIWDPRRRQVVLARDRLGEKPLYHMRVQGERGAVLLFASEVRALLATGRVARRVDPIALGGYVWNGYVCGPHTIVRDVSLLPAGSTMTVPVDDIDRATEGRYWQLPGAPTGATPADAAVAAAAERLRESVQGRLVSDVPLGIFLSGGVDSGVVTSLAMRASERPVKTFTMSFDEARYDESPHARAVADALGTEHHEVRLSESGFHSGLPSALRGLDQPSFDAVNTYFLSRAVRDSGLTVALAGTGGDELFGGYRSFRDLPRIRQAGRALGAVPRVLLRRGAAAASRLINGAAGEVPPQTRWGKLADVLQTRGRLLGMYQTSYALFTREFWEQLTAGARSAEIQAGLDQGLPRGRAAELRTIVNGNSVLAGITQLELACFLGERLLRDTDSTSMAASLEIRVPLIDHLFIEALAQVPDDRRFQPLGQKALLRELGLGSLDPALFDRPKAGFELPLTVWCRRGLSGDIEAVLNDEALAARVGVNGAALARLWRAWQAQAPGLYWSRVWSLFVLLWWCREHDLSV
jgi:asparagine synthase (glutamine-hydrolysing)